MDSLRRQGQERRQEGEEHEYSFLKWYYVFNLEQTEGIPVKAPPVKPIEEVEAVLGAVGANVTHGNTRAYYLPKFDQIHLPDPEDFNTMVDYYAVSLHEHTHWTGHSSRLNRPLVNRFGSEEYAEEELVAEWLGISLFPPSDYPRLAARPRGLYQELDSNSQGRQTSDLQGKLPCGKSRRLPPAES
jgi:antirestriction protein ArdC